MAGEFAPASLSAEDALVRPVWSILSTGFTGCGKTIFSCGKEFRPVYVFMCEGRLESVLTYYRKLDGNAKGIYYNDYTIDGGFFPLDQKMDAILARPEYKTIVVSSLTSFIRIVLKHLQKSNKKDDAGNMKGARMKGGIQVNSMEDYLFEDSVLINDLIAFFQTLKSNGVNVILEAHITPYEVKIGEQPNQTVKTVYDILTKGKKAPAELPSWFNEVWLFEKKVEGWEGKDEKYIINTKGSETNSCKTSFDIPSFEWTGIDPSIKLMSFVSPEIKANPTVDPSKPKMVAW